MKRKLSTAVLLPALVLLITACNEGYVGHIGATRLVILQPVPMAGNKSEENFRGTLELLCPHECHDTAFIQERVVLERIDLATPAAKEFVIPQNLVRDFFGSRNPGKKRALREDLLFYGDSAFEKHPGKAFLDTASVTGLDYLKTIGDYLARNRKNALVYFLSSDTLVTTFAAGGIERPVWHDPARLNCRIVADLRKKTPEELAAATVIIILLPPGTDETGSRSAPKRNRQSGTAPGREGYPKGAPCPPDTVVDKLNIHHNAVIREFRNLLHYIATTKTDDTLRRIYRDDAWNEINKIPGLVVQGVPGNDLRRFLWSGFSANISVTPVVDLCGVITGVRFGQ